MTFFDISRKMLKGSCQEKTSRRIPVFLMPEMPDTKQEEKKPETLQTEKMDILNAGRLMLDKIGTLLKAQYRAEKTGKIGTFLCRLAPNYMRFHLVEWSFVRRHKPFFSNI